MSLEEREVFATAIAEKLERGLEEMRATLLMLKTLREIDPTSLNTPYGPEDGSGKW